MYAVYGPACPSKLQKTDRLKNLHPARETGTPRTLPLEMPLFNYDKKWHLKTFIAILTIFEVLVNYIRFFEKMFGYLNFLF